jgi:hypothetical protein
MDYDISEFDIKHPKMFLRCIGITYTAIIISIIYHSFTSGNVLDVPDVSDN